MMRTLLKLMLATLMVITYSGCNSGDFAGESRKIDKPKPSEDGTPKEVEETGTPEDPDTPTDGGEVDEGGDETDPGDLTSDGDTTGPELDIDDGETKVLALDCPEGDDIPEIRLTGDGNKVQIEGEMCPRAFGKLTVLFVVDFSGSMAEADPRSILSLFSCGRSKAANAILKKIKDDMRDGDEVQIGFVSFGDSSKVETTFKDIADFSANTFNFCGSDNESTNYKAAFDLARQQLAGVEGNKALYFISDGLPTTGGPGQTDNNDSQGIHKKAGADSAQALKNDIKDLTFNAIFLNEGGAGTQAQTYLTSLTGDASKVKLANGAGELADKIVELSIPSVELEKASAEAVLTAVGFSDLPVELLSFDKKTDGVWEFKTEEFELNREPGETVENLFTLTAKDGAGQEHKAELELPLTSP